MTSVLLLCCLCHTSREYVVDMVDSSHILVVCFRSQFGTENGLKSLLVLSGVTTEEKLLSPENTITPDYYTDTINDFFAQVPAAKKA
jgi:hypothetical protein